MNNDTGSQFYEFVKSQGIKVPGTYDEFSKGMLDPVTGDQFYKFVKSQGIKVPPTFDEFQSAFVKKKADGSQQGQAVVTDTGKPASSDAPSASSGPVSAFDFIKGIAESPAFQRRATSIDRAVAGFQSKIPKYTQEQDVDRIDVGFSLMPGNAREAQEYISYSRKKKKAEEEHDQKRQEAFASGAQAFPVFNYPAFSSGSKAKYADDGRDASAGGPKPVDSSDAGAPGFLMTYDQFLKQTKKGKKRYQNYHFGDQTERVQAITKNIADPVGEFVNEELQAMSDEGTLPAAIERKRKAYNEAWKRLKEIDDVWGVEAKSKKIKDEEAGLKKLIADLSENGVFDPEKSVKSIALDIYSQDFLPAYKKKIIELIPENRRTPEFIENLTDKLFYESGVDLDLDGDGRFNDQRWIDDLAVSTKSGIKGVANAVEYGMTYVFSLPESEELRDRLLEDKRAEIREGTDLIQGQKTIFTRGIYDSLEAGDISSAMRQTANATGEALPLIATTVAGSVLTGGSGTPFLLASLPGALISGTVSGVNHYVQVRDLKDDFGKEIYGPDGALLSAFGVGFGEGLFSVVGSGIVRGAGNIGGKIFATPSTRDILNRTFREQFRGTQAQLIARYITGFAAKRGAAFSEEGATEMASGIFSEWVDSQVLGTKFDFAKSFKSQFDAFVTGGAVGLVFDGAGAPFRKGADFQAKVLANATYDTWYRTNVSGLDTQIEALESKMKAAESSDDKTELVQVAQQVDALKVQREELIQGRRTELMSVAANDRKSFDRLSKINADFAKEAATYRGILRNQIQKIADNTEFASEADKKAFIDNPSKETISAAIKAAKDVLAPIDSRIKQISAERDEIMAAERLSDPEKTKEFRDGLTQERAAELDKAISDAKLELGTLIDGYDDFMAGLFAEGLSEQEMDRRVVMRLNAQEQNEQRIIALEGMKGALNRTSNELSALYSDYEKAKASKDKKTAKDTLALIVAKEKELSDIAKLPLTQERIQALQNLIAQIDQTADVSQEAIPTRDQVWDQTKKASLTASVFQDVQALISELEGGTWGMLTAENPMKTQLSEEQNAKLNEEAKAWLIDKGYNPQEIFGKYDNSESSFFVPGLSRQHAIDFAKKFNQESVAHSEGMFYQDGSYNPRTGENSTGGGPDNFYSSINIGGEVVDFQVGYDTDTQLDTDGNKIEKPTEADTEAQTLQKVKELADTPSSETHSSFKANEDGTFNINWEEFGVTDPDAITALNSFIRSMQKAGANINSIVLLTGPNAVGVDRGEYFQDIGAVFLNIDLLKADKEKNFETEAQTVIQEEFGHSLFGAMLRSMDPEVRKVILKDLLNIYRGDLEVLTRFIDKASNDTYLNADNVSVEQRDRIISLHKGFQAIYDAKDYEAAYEAAIKMADEIFALNVTTEEGIQEVLSYAAAVGAKADKKNLTTRVKFIAWLNNIRSKFGFPPTLDSDSKAIDFINGIKRARAGSASFKLKGGAKGVSAASASKPVIIPRKLRSLGGVSKKAFLADNPDASFIDIDSLPDGPFEITYEVQKQYSSRGRTQYDSETKTHKFNDRSHFINWWKKTNLHRDASYGRTDKVAGIPLKKDRFSMFSYEGKLIDTFGLESTYLKPEDVPFFRVKVDGPGSFAFNSLVTDLKAMYDDGVITKKNYYGQLNVAKTSLDKIQKLETSDRNASYWLEVETLKRQHIRQLQSVPTLLKDTGTDAKFSPMSGFYGPATGERIPDFPTYTGFKNGSTSSSRFQSSSKAREIRRNEPKRVDDKIKELFDRDFKDLGKSAGSNAKFAASIIVYAEDFIKNNSHILEDITSPEGQTIVFSKMLDAELRSILDLVNSKDGGIPELPGEFQKNYEEARDNAISTVYKKENINREINNSDRVIFTLIDAILSDGNLQSRNSKAALNLFRLVAMDKVKNEKWVIPSDVLDFEDFKTLIPADRLDQIKRNIDFVNQAIAEHGKQVGDAPFNPSAFLAWAMAPSKDPKSSSLSNMQVLLARTAQNETGAMGKLGAYFNFLMGGNKDLIVDTHNFQFLSLFNGVLFGSDYLPNGNLKQKGRSKLEKVAKQIDNRFEYTSDQSLIDFLVSDESQSKIEADKTLKNDYCSAARECYQIQTISNKRAKELKDVIEKAIPYLDEKVLTDLGFTDAAGNLRKIGISEINQLVYVISQVGRKGATTPNATVLNSLSKTGDLFNSEEVTAHINSIKNTRLTGERDSVELTGSTRKRINLNNAQVLGDVTFNPNKDAISKVRDGEISASTNVISQSGTTKVIQQQSMQMIELITDPYSGDYPRTESGEMISKAETVVTKNGKTYVSGKLEVVPDEGNVNDLKDVDAGLTESERKAAVENTRTALKEHGINVDAEEALGKMSAQGQKRAANNTFKSSSPTRTIRRTVGKAAAKMPGIKQDLLANPENYIAPQNLQNIKDNLETMSEQDLISMMRDDALGMLQNRNDDTGVMAGAELLNRAMQRGDTGAAKLLIEELAKMGTSAGRILRQFRELKLTTPKGMSDVIQRLIEKKGNTLTPEQKAKLDDITERMYKLRDEYNDLVKRSMAGENLDAELATSSNNMANVEKELNTMMNALYERGWGEIGKMLIQGNLLTPMSQTTNVGANLVNLVGSSFVDILSIPTERLLNMLGMEVEYKRRYSLMAYLHGLKAMGGGIVEAGKSAVTGKRIDQSTEWTQSRGFMPIQSLLAVLSKEDLPLNSKGVPSMSQRLKLAAQATAGVPAEVMFRTLSFGDIPFRRFAEARELYKIGRSKGLKGDALKKFMKFPDKHSLDIAQREGRKLTFQEKTTVSEFSRKAVESTERLMSDGLRHVVGDKVVDPSEVSKFIVGAHIPYLMTPSNILHETMTYLSPIYATARIASGIRRKDARAVSENFGKMMVGSMLTSTAVLLIKEGLMSGALDVGEDEEKNIAYDQFPPSSINVSGLKRFLNGGNPAKQENDMFVGYSKLGIAGSVFGAVAKGVDKQALSEMDYDQMSFMHKAFMGYLGVSPMAGISSVMDQSFMQGMETMLSTITSAGERDFDQNVEKAISTFFKAVTATTLPNTLSAVHRAEREYMPDMRVTRDMTMLERTLKSFEYAIMDRTFNTDGVPVRVDWKGNKIKQTPTGADPIMYQLFDITKSRTAESDKVSNEIWRLYEKTGELTDVVGTPNFAKKSSFDIPGETSLRSKKVRRAVESLSREYTFLSDEEFTSGTTYLNTARLNELMEIAGKMRFAELTELVGSEEYSNMSDEEKISAMNKVDSRYTHKIAMDGDVLMPHTIKILDYMQDDYESIER